MQKQPVPFMDRLINPEFQKLWPSLFHIHHLKAKVAVYALPPHFPLRGLRACRIDCISGSNTSLCKMTLSPSKSAENPGSGAEHAVRMECRKAPRFFLPDFSEVDLARFIRGL